MSFIKSLTTVTLELCKCFMPELLLFQVLRVCMMVLTLFFLFQKKIELLQNSSPDVEFRVDNTSLFAMISRWGGLYVQPLGGSEKQLVSPYFLKLVFVSYSQFFEVI